jgi:integrase
MKKPINPIHFISLYLDTRRSSDKGKFPVKLRVFSKIPRKQKLYSTIYKLSEKEFSSIWETTKPRTEYKVLRANLQAVVTKAEELAASITPFSFEALEKALLSKNDSRQNVFFQYDEVILKLRTNKQFGTANNYEHCAKSLKEYIKQKTGTEAKELLFTEITPSWLQKYENYMIEEKKKSPTTVSMYLRTLRTLFNIAKDAKDIEPEIYPFGRRLYQIPAVSNVKKALNKATLKTLFEAKPKTFEEERAKDLFFFSYTCNGMNIKDVAELKFSDLREDSLQFFRAKTKKTSKANMKPVVIHLTEFTKGVIEKYGVSDRNTNNYIFPFLSHDVTPYENFRRVKNLTISINHNIKKLATSAGITENISSYSARHSFATNAVRNGASMEYISEALSHSNMKTTQNYFAGFEEETKKEITEKLMQF